MRSRFWGHVGMRDGGVRGRRRGGGDGAARREGVGPHPVQTISLLGKKENAVAASNSGGNGGSSKPPVARRGRRGNERCWSQAHQTFGRLVRAGGRPARAAEGSERAARWHGGVGVVDSEGCGVPSQQSGSVIENGPCCRKKHCAFRSMVYAREKRTTEMRFIVPAPYALLLSRGHIS